MTFHSAHCGGWNEKFWNEKFLIFYPRKGFLKTFRSKNFSFHPTGCGTNANFPSEQPKIAVYVFKTTPANEPQTAVDEYNLGIQQSNNPAI